jgi:hypothetical protein
MKKLPTTMQTLLADRDCRPVVLAILQFFGQPKNRKFAFEITKPKNRIVVDIRALHGKAEDRVVVSFRPGEPPLQGLTHAVEELCRRTAFGAAHSP